MQIQNLITDRLILAPYTKEIGRDILAGDYHKLYDLGFNLARGWPDAVALDTIPRILINLEKVSAPTGFETWMIVKKEGMQVIGDAGFKGVPDGDGAVDIGYGIIKEEHKKGYALEAAQALVNWAFLQPQVKKITAKCLIANIASANVLRKLRFIEILRNEEMIYWQLLKDVKV